MCTIKNLASPTFEIQFCREYFYDINVNFRVEPSVPTGVSCWTDARFLKTGRKSGFTIRCHDYYSPSEIV